MRKINRRRTVAYSTSIALLAGLAVAMPSTSSADPIGEDECFPAVLMLRGSGENRLLTESTSGGERHYYPEGSNASSAMIQTNGLEGETLGRALETVSTDEDIADVASRLRFVGIDYPALPVMPELEKAPVTPDMDIDTAREVEDATRAKNTAIALKHTFKYLNSINEGAASAAQFINKDIQSGCDTQYTIMGYSQGALSARLAMNLGGNNTDKVISSYLFGDPYQKANGAMSTRQLTSASTGAHREGTVRKGLAIASSLVGYPGKLGLDKLADNIAESDQTAYRDDLAASVSSRILCHEFDVVCWTPAILGESWDVKEHANYYLEKDQEGNETAGKVDLELEPEQFMRQLTELANSQTANPRERSLTKTSSVLGKNTIYNVANSRSDDMCSWDVGSDGSFEPAVVCDLKEVQENSDVSKMTVRVQDTFGFTYTYSTEEAVVDPEVLEQIDGVPYNKWVRFESADGTKCVTNPQNFKYGTTTGEYSGSYVKADDCLTSPSSKRELNATQVFKRTQVNYPLTGNMDEYLSGYDDNYRISTSDAPSVEYDVRGFLAEKKYTGGPDYGVKAELAQIKNGTKYYQFKLKWVSRWSCVDSSATEGVAHCEPGRESQLFKATTSNGDYGAQSVERDKTPPTAVENFKMENRNGYDFTFSWSPSADDRTDSINYYKFSYYDTNWNGWESRHIEGSKVSDQQFVPFNWSDTEKQVRISACDYSNNCSAPSELTIQVNNG